MQYFSAPWSMCTSCHCVQQGFTQKFFESGKISSVCMCVCVCVCVPCAMVQYVCVSYTCTYASATCHVPRCMYVCVCVCVSVPMQHIQWNPLYKDTPEMRTSSLIGASCTAPSYYILKEVQETTPEMRILPPIGTYYAVPTVSRIERFHRISVCHALHIMSVCIYIHKHHTPVGMYVMYTLTH